jgi:hypothetical protein
MINRFNEGLAIMCGVAYMVILGYESVIPLEVYMILKTLPCFLMAHDTENTWLKLGIFCCALSDAMMEIDDAIPYESVYFYLTFLFSFGYLGFFHQYFWQQSDGNTKSPRFAGLCLLILILVLYPCMSGIMYNLDDPILCIFVFVFGVVMATSVYQSYIMTLDTDCSYSLLGSLVGTVGICAMALDKFAVGYQVYKIKFYTMPLRFMSIILLARCVPGNEPKFNGARTV